MVSVNDGTFGSVPIRVGASIRLLADLLQVTAIGGDVQIVDLGVFTVDRGASVAADRKVVEDCAHGHVLRVAASKVTNVIIYGAVNVAAVDGFEPVAVGADARFRVVRRVVIVVRADVVALGVIFRLGTLFVRRASECMGVELIISANY